MTYQHGRDWAFGVADQPDPTDRSHCIAVRDTESTTPVGTAAGDLAAVWPRTDGLWIYPTIVAALVVALIVAAVVVNALHPNGLALFLACAIPVLMGVAVTAVEAASHAARTAGRERRPRV